MKVSTLLIDKSGFPRPEGQGEPRLANLPESFSVAFTVNISRSMSKLGIFIYRPYKL